MPSSRGRHLLLWALGRLRRVRVSGPSMLPTLQPGETVLVDPRAAPRAGDLVLALHPHQDLLVIKRVSRIDPHGVELLGDNPAQSTDSRHYGPLPLERLRGRVVCTFL